MPPAQAALRVAGPRSPRACLGAFSRAALAVLYAACWVLDVLAAGSAWRAPRARARQQFIGWSFCESWRDWASLGPPLSALLSILGGEARLCGVGLRGCRTLLVIQRPVMSLTTRTRVRLCLSEPGGPCVRLTNRRVRAGAWRGTELLRVVWCQADSGVGMASGTALGSGCAKGAPAGKRDFLGVHVRARWAGRRAAMLAGDRGWPGRSQLPSRSCACRRGRAP